MTERIRVISEQSRQTYGSPWVHADLAAAGIRRGRKRVAWLMRMAGLVGCHRRRHLVTTVHEPKAALAPDHCLRQFAIAAPNPKWTADMTDVPT